MGRGTCHGSPETDLGKGGGGKLIGFTRKEDLELQERNFLAVQWLGLHAEGAGSIPGGGTEILQAVRCSQKKVKGRIIEILFSWTVWFPEDIKIRDAYQMLKKQGLTTLRSLPTVVVPSCFSVVCHFGMKAGDLVSSRHSNRG